MGNGGTLLVLGEPGAGKTTLLMELAKDWLGCTDAQQGDQAIPVVLNLSSWGTYRLPKQQQLTFADWVVEELHRHYQLRSQVGKIWLEKSSFVLLLDGLDEVREPLRESCIAALNQFRQELGTIEIAVCSRIADYKKLTTTLEHFQAAVFIQPLDNAQIETYLQQAGEPLKGVRKAISQDPTLLEMARTPLFLWILSLAYPRRSADELLNLSKPERLRRLFDRYIEQMFHQRPMAIAEQQKMIRWLGLLAQRIGIEKEFLIERMQPSDWFIKLRHKLLYRLITSLIILLAVSIAFGQYFIIIPLFAMIPLIIDLFNKSNDEIYVVESIEIPKSRAAWRKIYCQVKRDFDKGLVIIYVLGFCLFLGVIFGWITGFFLGLVILFSISIYSLILGMRADIQKYSEPNQGIWNSFQYLFIFSVIDIFLTYFLDIFLASHGK